MSRVRDVVAIVAAVLVRPGLWPALLALALRLVPDRWWRGPLPPRAYLEYRGQGVFGAPLSEIPPGELIRYLEWCRAFPGPIE